MGQIKKLALMIKDLEADIAACNRCGMCQAVCPLFKTTGKEADVARGKIALLEGLTEQLFDNPKGVGRRLDKCLLCGACAANCAGKVNTVELFLKARTILSGFMGLSAPKKIALKALLNNTRTTDRLFQMGAAACKITTKPASTMIGTSCMRMGADLFGQRHFKLPAKKPFHLQSPTLDKPPGRSGLKAAFFTGCLIDRFFPEIAKSTLNVLEHYGVGVYMPKDQVCCGIPALASGDLDTFETLMAQNLALFEKSGFDVLVTACATCTFTLAKIWPLFAENPKDNLPARIQKLARKTIDINAFLARYLPTQKTTAKNDQNGQKTTYHDPCHLKKSLGVFQEPRDLIQSTSGYVLTEMEKPDTCCGMGGSFNLKYQDISADIGNKKRAYIKQSGCDIVATGCPACMLQISDMLSRHNDKIKVMHTIQIHEKILGG